MIDIVGLVVLLIFYAAILFVGIFATRWYKNKILGGASDSQEVALVAGRQLGPWIGVFTMTATTVGGGYVNGTSESVARDGIAWTLAPFGICVGLILGGVLFAKRMREQNYLTMFDPFQEKYGSVMVILLYLASICGDVFWAASVLAALGTSLSVIINLDQIIAMVISACVAILYIMFGQVISVAYTDVVQLIFITGGLVLALPFIFLNPAVTSLTRNQDQWVGSIERADSAVWVDLLITMTFGTIPWQTYFQRVLSVKTATYAQVLSIAGGLGAFILAIPPGLVGVVAASADWNQTDLGVSPIEMGQASMVLPLALKYLTPRPVAIVGLGAIAAAVMSSLDSAILASSSVFTHNIYKLGPRSQASETELAWVQRIAVLVVGAIATLVAIFVPSIYGIFIMAADIVFVIMFPQLFCVIFISNSNGYGSLVGFIIGLLLRILAGEPLLSLPTLLPYPYYDWSSNQQYFPFRTFAMLCSLVAIVTVSYITHYMFTNKKLTTKYDFLQCFKSNEASEIISDGQPHISQIQLLGSQEVGNSQGHNYMYLENSDSPDGTNIPQSPNLKGNTENGYSEENFTKSVADSNFVKDECHIVHRLSAGLAISSNTQDTVLNQTRL